jgi:hypothetical protein
MRQTVLICGKVLLATMVAGFQLLGHWYMHLLEIMLQEQPLVQVV